MRKFETPEIEIIKFSTESIMTDSNDLGFTPFSINEDELEIAEIG